MQKGGSLAAFPNIRWLHAINDGVLEHRPLIVGRSRGVNPAPLVVGTVVDEGAEAELDDRGRAGLAKPRQKLCVASCPKMQLQL